MKKEILIQVGKNSKEFRYFKGKIFPHLMKWEGGGTLHKVSGDSGGWTIWGIAYNYNSEYFYSFKDFKNTTREEAAALAFLKYYLPLHPENLREDVKLYVADTAYNLGVKKTIRLIQKCIGVKRDGIIGFITLSKLHNLDKDCIHKLRVNWYNYLGSFKRKKKFLKGWLNRADNTYLKS